MQTQIHNFKLTDFEPDKIQKAAQEKEEENKISSLLQRFSAEMLKDRLRSNGGHPEPEWGQDDTWRFHYLDECKRRGIKLLEQLGWPTDENTLYVNIYTGCVETLIDVATSNGYFSDIHTISNQVWSIIEHWEPYDETKPNHHKIKYLQNEIERLNCIIQRGGAKDYMKRTKAEIREKQYLLEDEISKMPQGEAQNASE